MKKTTVTMLSALAAVLLAAVLLTAAVPFAPGGSSVFDAMAATPEESKEGKAVDAGETEGIDWKAPDQEEAKQRASKVVPFVEAVVDECLLCRQQKLRDKGYGVKDITHSYFLLDSPVIKKREDMYGPVRFMHSKHAASMKDCAVCHHARPADPEASETTRCSACHQESFQEDHPERIGLKAAYHLNCMGCHEKMNQGPVDCAGCHRKNVHDHDKLVQLPANPEPTQVTDECLRCHKTSGEDMLSTVHWLWRGHSPYTMDHRREVRHGKGTTAINNF